ncbi:MAG: HPr(Ser) kinase/phosphatase [Verrucomicrobia bacterium]|nr:HPr(Ser) kinase/phosphatase [Verrucomicrobiota bacterium]MBU1909665.1 HPr(Ser) kinase/phosphatase [Verrucomicrobiota bacterium]
MGITVRQFLDTGGASLGLALVAGEKYLDRIVPEEALNRPGLALAGFLRYFAFRRIQVLGLAEMTYLKTLADAERSARLKQFFESQIPCVVVTRSRHLFPEMEEMAEHGHVPVLKTSMVTSRFINEATIIMENLVAPRLRAQGTMVDILGIGVLIEGKPGIGKSETALALIERGHSLVADDLTVLRRDSSGVIIGAAVEITSCHMEIRGLGIIHVPSLFGVASMRKEMRLDLIVRLHRPEPGDEDERTGLNPQHREVLGVPIPVITIPVAAGRDLAHVVEVAALNQKLKQMGHDAAKELDEKLMKTLTRQPS